MDLLFGLGTEYALDRKLDRLVEPILRAIHPDPPEPEIVKVLEGLKVELGADPRDVNARCLPTADGGTTVHVGHGLYVFTCLYARCVSTKFLPATPGGPRPSPAWPDALSALASYLDWLAVPIRDAEPAPIDLGDVQENRATIFGNLTYRAAICHELAHAVLGHHHVATTDDVLDARSREVEADVLGMRLHLDTLPHEAMRESAAASLVYNVYATSLLRFRLMILAEVVDTERWSFLPRHPDPLERFAALVANAEHRYGDEIVRLMWATQQDLEEIGGQIRTCLVDQRESVRDEVLDLARSVPAAAGPVDERMHALLAVSPTGVVRAIDILNRDGAPSEVLRGLFDALPRPVQRFCALPFSDRADRVLNRVTR